MFFADAVVEFTFVVTYVVVAIGVFAIVCGCWVGVVDYTVCARVCIIVAGDIGVSVCVVGVGNAI